MKKSLALSLMMVAVCLFSICAWAQEANSSATNLRITEFLSTANGKEFIELTNMGHAPIDMTGWSYDDESANAGTFDLSGFGIIESAESVILTNGDVDDFIADWGLTNIKVMRYLSPTLDVNDQINIYSATDALIDCLTFGPDDFPGSVITDSHSAFPVTADIGTDNIHRWLLSREGDVQYSYASANDDIGNPGLVKFIIAQEDIGFGGPGEGQFWIYGPKIASGNRVDVLLRRASMNQVAFLFMTFQSNPTPAYGGIVVPAPPLITYAVITVPSDRCEFGEVFFKTECGGGPVNVFCQFVYVDPDQVQGYGFSNALKLDIHP